MIIETYEREMALADVYKKLAVAENKIKNAKLLDRDEVKINKLLRDKFNRVLQEDFKGIYRIFSKEKINLLIGNFLIFRSSFSYFVYLSGVTNTPASISGR